MSDATRVKAGEWAKQVAVWLGITCLLPMTVWYGTAAFFKPPDAAEEQRTISRIDQQINDAKDPAEKQKLISEKEAHERQDEVAEKAFVRDLFWVGYPIGLLAFAIGTAVPVQAVGAGLMFGGIGTIATDCVFAWEGLGRWLHLGSLSFALATIIVLGTWRLRARTGGAAV